MGMAINRQVPEPRSMRIVAAARVAAPYSGAREGRGVCGYVFESGDGYGHGSDGYHHECHAGHDGRDDPAELGQPERQGELDEGCGDYQAGHYGQPAFRNGQNTNGQEWGAGAHQHYVSRAQTTKFYRLMSGCQPTNQQGCEDRP